MWEIFCLIYQSSELTISKWLIYVIYGGTRSTKLTFIIGYPENISVLVTKHPFLVIGCVDNIAFSCFRNEYESMVVNILSKCSCNLSQMSCLLIVICYNVFIFTKLRGRDRLFSAALPEPLIKHTGRFYTWLRKIQNWRIHRNST